MAVKGHVQVRSVNLYAKCASGWLLKGEWGGGGSMMMDIYVAWSSGTVCNNYHSQLLVVYSIIGRIPENMSEYKP